MNNDPNNRLDAALALAEMHFSVIPLWWPSALNQCGCGNLDCKSKAKHPIASLVPNGIKDATLDPHLIREFWTRYPKANIGVSTGSKSGNLAVIDLDGDAAIRRFKQLCDEHGTPELYSDNVCRIQTGTGWHIWAINFNEEISKGRIWAGAENNHVGIDLVVGDGAYVVSPTSRHASGAWYKFMGDSRKLPILPDWICEMSAKPSTWHGLSPGQELPKTIPAAYIKAGLRNCVEAMSNTREGERDMTMSRLGSKVGGWLHYLPEEERQAWGDKMYEAALSTGLTAQESSKVYDAIRNAQPYLPPPDKMREFDAQSPLKHAGDVHFDILGGNVGWDDLDGVANDTPDWLVPDLFLRGTTFALTGNGGAGKMTWLRQLGIRIAGGIHPFKDNVKIPQQRVMFIDLQDDKEVNAHNWKGIWDSFGSYEAMMLARNNSQLVSFPSGCNIFSEAHHAEMERHIAEFKPDMVIVGPVYRMFEGDGIKEDVVRGVTRIIDAWIDKYKCAFFIEAHPPKGNAKGEQVKSIAGSSVWERWAQSGYFASVQVMTESHLRVMRLEAWRYPRLQYDFVPDHFTSEGLWLWNAKTQEQYESEQEDIVSYNYGDCIKFLRAKIFEWPKKFHTFISVQELNATAHDAGFRYYHIRRAMAQLHGSEVEKHRARGEGGQWMLVPKNMKIDDMKYLGEVTDEKEVADLMAEVFTSLEPAPPEEDLAKSMAKVREASHVTYDSPTGITYNGALPDALRPPYEAHVGIAAPIEYPSHIDYQIGVDGRMETSEGERGPPD